MSNILYIPESHLRIAENADGTVTVSLSSHLLSLLGRPTWFECAVSPEAVIPPNSPFCTLETDKTAYEVALPFEAAFVAVNGEARDSATVARAVSGPDGWVCKVRPRSTAWRERLLDEECYVAFIAP